MSEFEDEVLADLGRYRETEEAVANVSLWSVEGITRVWPEDEFPLLYRCIKVDRATVLKMFPMAPEEK